MDSSSKIVVIGAGAIGGITAGFLKKAGYDVTLVTRYPEAVVTIENSGLEITGIRGNFRIPVPAVSRIADIPHKADVVFLATKTTDIDLPAREALKIMGKDSILVSMQNGIVEEDLEKIVGKERLISCVVGWGATMLSPSRLEMTSTGDFVIGNYRGVADNRLAPLKEMMDSVLETRISENMQGYLYSKLIINSCITSLGAITGLTLGNMLKQKKIRNLFLCVMKEAMDVAHQMNLNVEKYGGKVDYYDLTSPAGMMKKFWHHLLLRIIGFKYRRLKSSSLQSLERGRPTEVDSLNGYIVRKATEYSVPVPLNEKIVSIIHEIEQKRRKSHPENLDQDIFIRCSRNPGISNA